MGRWLQPGISYQSSGIITLPTATGSTTTSIIIPSKTARVLEFSWTQTTAGTGAATVTLNLRERAGATDRCGANFPTFGNTDAANTITRVTGGDQGSGMQSSGGTTAVAGSGIFPEASEFDRLDLRVTLSVGTTTGAQGILFVKFQE